MPEKETLRKAQKDLREGKSPSTAAGAFVREEVEHVREGKHGVRSPEQAIATGLSKARRAGIPLRAPSAGKVGNETRERAERDFKHGQAAPETHDEGAASRAKSRLKAMKREPRNTVSRASLSRHAETAAERRKNSDR